MRYFMTAMAAAGLLLGTAAGAAVPSSAHAATPSCGGTCVAPYVQSWGRQDVLDVYKQGERTGTPVIMFRESDSDPAEDWKYSSLTTVANFRAQGLVSGAVALQYGSDEAYELEYAPFGAPTGLCMGLSAAVQAGAKVSLQPCGATAATVWITDQADAGSGGIPVINGADTNFSDPFVLTYTGTPDAMPRAQLYVTQLDQFSSDTVYDTQLWNATEGVLH